MKKLLSAIFVLALCVGLWNYVFDEAKGTNSKSKTTASNKAKSVQTVQAKETVNPAIYNISIESVKMSKNSIGVPLLYIVFQNNGEDTVDRIDFRIRCYNTYGELIRPSLLSDGKQYFFDTNLKKGKKSDKDRFLSLDGFTGVRTVEIAIVKYHTTNDKTIEVPENLLKYQKYKFQ